VDRLVDGRPDARLQSFAGFLSWGFQPALQPVEIAHYRLVHPHEPSGDRICAKDWAGELVGHGPDALHAAGVAEHHVHLVAFEPDLDLSGRLFLRGEVSGVLKPDLVELRGQHFDIDTAGGQGVAGGAVV
jgi:hypothetical protein